MRVPHGAKSALVGLTFAASLLGASVVAGTIDGPRGSTGVQVLEGAGILSEAERAELLSAGPQWVGTGRFGLSEVEATAMAPSGALWAGESVLGYNLQAITVADYAPPPGVQSRGEHSVRFNYGVCQNPGFDRPSCAWPVQILVESVCAVRPEEVAVGALVRDEAAREATVRGKGQLLRFADGHVELWTGEVHIWLDTPGQPELVEMLIPQLKGFGETTLEPWHEFVPPDWKGCE